MGRDQYRRFFLLLFITLLFSLLYGCTTGKIVKQTPLESLPKSEKPIVQLVKKEQSDLEFRVFNNSGRAFPNMLITITGKECSGGQSKRSWLILHKKPLMDGESRRLKKRLSTPCQDVRVSAISVQSEPRASARQPRLRRQIPSRQPVIRTRLPIKVAAFQKQSRKLTFRVANPSRLYQTQRIFILVLASGCQSSIPTYRRSFVDNIPLSPGHIRTRSFVLPTLCQKISLRAYGEFRSLRRRIPSRTPSINPTRPGTI